MYYPAYKHKQERSAILLEIGKQIILVNKEIDFSEQMKQYDTFLYGRRTYEAVAREGSRYPKSAAHYVFSHSLDRVADGFILVKGDLRKEVLAIEQSEGKDIAAIGGAGLLTSLLNQDLVDELSISIIPVLLGVGKPMVNFLDERISLSLIKTHTYSNGTVNLTYQVSKAGEQNPD